ncbi:mitochondrial carrier domain-containing protein [Entophlyctis helioformis]|nr:mitochondrial carrier domain-containing protein [Entophlyctis helioformis]
MFSMITQTASAGTQGFRRLDDDTVHMFAGSIAGLTAAVLVCPLDIVKVRLQNQGKPDPLRGGPKYVGISGTLKTIFREEGLRGCYRGLGATTLAYMIDRAIWFPIYHRFKTLFSDQAKNGNHALAHLSASVSASSLCLVLTNPLWVLRTRVMSQSQFNYTSIVNGLSTMVRSEGWTSLYKGLGPSFLGLSHVAVQFPLYEQLKIWIRDWQVAHHLDTNGNVNTWGLLTASAVSKLVASVATYPHEVLRTRLQTQKLYRTHLPLDPPEFITESIWRGPSMTASVQFPGKPQPQQQHQQQQPQATAASSSSSQLARAAGSNGALTTQEPAKYRGVVQTARVIVSEEGWRALYKGMGANLVRTVPASAFSLCMYELIVRNMGSYT